jgi:hypothetical protein
MEINNWTVATASRNHGTYASRYRCIIFHDGMTIEVGDGITIPAFSFGAVLESFDPNHYQQKQRYVVDRSQTQLQTGTLRCITSLKRDEKASGKMKGLLYPAVVPNSRETNDMHTDKT